MKFLAPAEQLCIRTPLIKLCSYYVLKMSREIFIYSAWHMDMKCQKTLVCKWLHYISNSSINSGICSLSVKKIVLASLDSAILNLVFSSSKQRAPTSDCKTGAGFWKSVNRFLFSNNRLTGLVMVIRKGWNTRFFSSKKWSNIIIDVFQKTYRLIFIILF